jgi:hypothetical protein
MMAKYDDFWIYDTETGTKRPQTELLKAHLANNCPTYGASLIQADIRLTTPERHMLIDALAAKLQGLHSVGGTRADYVETAVRILELAKSLPDDGDAA